MIFLGLFIILFGMSMIICGIGVAMNEMDIDIDLDLDIIDISCLSDCFFLIATILLLLSGIDLLIGISITVFKLGLFVMSLTII